MNLVSLGSLGLPGSITIWTLWYWSRIRIRIRKTTNPDILEQISYGILKALLINYKSILLCMQVATELPLIQTSPIKWNITINKYTWLPVKLDQNKIIVNCHHFFYRSSILLKLKVRSGYWSLCLYLGNLGVRGKKGTSL